MSAFALAFVAGLVTILNPCVIPLVPILVASSLSQHRHGPLALAMGLGLSFTLFGFALIAFGFQLGISPETVRLFAGWTLVVAGVVLSVPRLQAHLTSFASPMTNWAGRSVSKVRGDGLGGQFSIGLLLGLVWAPCVGPTLGAAIAAASQGQNLAQAFLIFLTFSVGVSVSFVLFAGVSRKAIGGRRRELQSIARYAKPLFAAVLTAVGLMIVSGFDRIVEAWALEHLPLWLVQFTTRF